MANNIYGMQTIPETKIRDGWDIASSTTGAAAQGAKIGSKFGAMGALVGTAGGAAMGFMGAKQGQSDERVMNETDKQHNTFVDSLEGRSMRSANYVRAQAEQGMQVGKYMVAEIEGDGSKYKKGIGEIHTDKNFNIKTIASGAPTHEQGGLDVVMEEGDIVFPTQGNENKFNKILNAINRYKLKGDSKAKDFLTKERDSLPTDEDYQNNTQYEDGVSSANPGPYTDETWEAMLQNQKYFGPNFENASGSNGGNVVTGKGNQQKEKEDSENTTYRVIKDYKPDGSNKADDWEYRLNNQTGDVDVRKKGETSWRKRDESWNKPNANEKGLTNMELTRQRVFGDWEPSVEAPETTETFADTRSPEPNQRIATAQELPTEEARGPEEPLDETQQKYNLDDATAMDEHNNPLKYASVLNNLVQGTGPADTVNRRYYTPEEYDYKDRSYFQRKAALEQRNASNNMLRGKGLSIGQQQGYQGQTGARYLNQTEGINEAEARRADQVDYMNTGNINQAKTTNIGLANQYDTWDAQNEAARQKYFDTAMSETSELAQYDEQTKYMRSRNAKQYEMDKMQVGLLNDIYPNYYITEDDLGNVKYRKKYD